METHFFQGKLWLVHHYPGYPWLSPIQMAINGEFTWRQPPPRAPGPFRSPAAPWCSATAHPPASPTVRALAEWPKRRLLAPIWCLKKCGCSGIYTYDCLWSRYPQIPQISLPQSSGNLDRVATLVPVFLEWPYAMHGFVSITSNTTQWNPTVCQHSTWFLRCWRLFRRTMPLVPPCSTFPMWLRFWTLQSIAC